MGCSIKYYLKYVLLAVALTYGSITLLAQQAVVVDNTPLDDARILQALNGGGMQFYLGTGDGLLSGNMSQQIVLFSGGMAANLAMEEGILFATGKARSHLNKRNEDRSYGDVMGFTYDDPDLKGIFNAAKYDAVIYKFKVTMASHTSAIRVVFQFGSEEYPNFVGSVYNDAFGFFVRPVSGGAVLPGGASVINIAKLPNTGLPISVNTVNYGIKGSQSQNVIPGLDLTQSQHYINNGHSTNTTDNGTKLATNTNNGPKPIFVEYNAITKLITYDLTGLTPGGTYEFKLAIADASDAQYDSGIFLKKVQGTTGADVKIIKEVNNMQPNVGDEVEFTLTATNLGPYLASNTRVNDLLPTGYEYVSHTASNTTSYNPTTGLWQIGALEAIHQTETLKIRAKVKEFGEYKNQATIASDELDPDYENNTSSVEPTPINPCVEEYLFIDDFGTSSSSQNSGRLSSLYMPTATYKFGAAHPGSSIDQETSIGAGYYAVVAPGYVKNGWKPSLLGNYNWTPSYDDPGAITDVSGVLSGGVMAVNAKKDLEVFYQRQVSLDYGNAYRASFQLYVVNGSAEFAIDIIDATTGNVLGTMLTEVYSSSNKNWVSVEEYFRLPGATDMRCDVSNILFSIRNIKEDTSLSNFYIDNINLTRLNDSPGCYPTTVVDLGCPSSRLILTNPALPNKGR